MNKNDRPDAALIGADENIFNLIGIAYQALREHGFPEEATEMKKRALHSHSYEEALNTITEYVNPVDAEEEKGMKLE